MRVLNQLDYENILYPTSLVKGEQPAEPYPSVAKAGCGLICACMLVGILTDKQLEPQEAVRISVRAGANHFGTDMPIFAKEIAERYGLELSSGSSKEELVCVPGRLPLFMPVNQKDCFRMVVILY